MTPRVQDLLATLVGFDTTSRDSNLALVEFVESLLDTHGVAHHRVPDAEGTRANLVARIGPDVAGGVVLCAHTDCVPVDGQPWTRDPFVLTEQDGRLYGRGTSDMKGFLAVVLAALPELVAAELERPVLLVLTYGEEVGTVGAPDAVAAMLDAHPRPAAVVVGEPTSMQVVNAHKGVRSFTTTVEGLDGHSSQPQHASSAIAALVRIATHIDDLAAAHRVLERDPRFTPPYTTFNLGTIHGGQAINIVSRHAELTWEYRPVPADDSESILEGIERYAHDHVLPRLRAETGVGEITFRRNALVVALDGDVEDTTAVDLVRELTGGDGPPRTVPFGTDGGHFQAAGLATVVCGPGSIDQAHQPDEWIEVDQLDRCAAFVEALIGRLSR